jgi:hypothetical protein
MANRFAGFGDNGGVPRIRLAKPKTPTKSKVRLAGNVAIDDEDGFIPEAKKGTTMTDYDISRGPYHAILDKMALARQAETGESYAKAYTECYTDPKNAAIRDGVRYDELARAFDSSHGTAKSLIPVTKAAALDDPLRKAADVAEHLGPAHARLHSMAVDHQRAHSGNKPIRIFTRGRKTRRFGKKSRLSIWPRRCGLYRLARRRISSLQNHFRLMAIPAIGLTIRSVGLADFPPIMLVVEFVSPR